MTYLQKNSFRSNKNNSGRKKTFWIVLVITLLIILIALFSPKLIPGKFNEAGKPLWKFREFFLTRTVSLTSFLNSKNDLIEKNNNLRDENSVLKRDLLILEALKQENEELKSILGREESENRIVARVLSKADQSMYSTIIIDVGKDKVFKGQEVFSGNSIIIGLVDEVYENTSKILLLSAPQNTYDVEVGDESVSAEAIGLGNGGFEIKLPRGVEIEIGDEVVSPNLSIRLLGIVEHIDSSPENSLQTILFKTPVNINQIKWVEIESNA